MKRLASSTKRNKNNMKLRNIYLGLKDQLPLSRLLRNLFKGHLWGTFSRRSHENEDGRLKVMYNTKASAAKAAVAMAAKRNKYFSHYKCFRCDGFHIGKNKENK